MLALVLHDLGAQLETIRVDLVQFPSSYFFYGSAPDLSLAPALGRLQSAVGRDELPPEARTAAAGVRASLQTLGDALRDGPFGLGGAADARAALDAYAADHRCH